MRDTRITAAIGVDPGLTYAFTDASVAAIDLPVLLINLGGEERLKAADVGAAGSNLVGRLPHVEYVTAAPANHFTFLALCKPAGREISWKKAMIQFATIPQGRTAQRSTKRSSGKSRNSCGCEIWGQANASPAEPLRLRLAKPAGRQSPPC